MYRFAIVAAASVAVAPIPGAWAANCAVGDAPALWVSASCNAGVAAGPDVCWEDSNALECDIDHGTGSWPPAVYGVSNYGGAGAPYAFYGHNRDNAKFCCAFDSSPAVRFINYYGSGLDDTLWFRGHDEAWWIEYAGGAVEFQLGVEALGGADDICDTPCADADLVQYLLGYDGSDTIRCDSSCVAVADGGADTVVTSDYDDLVYGDSWYYGSRGTPAGDYIRLGPGDDVAYGGDFGDYVCSDGGEDGVYGEDGSDTLWGGIVTLGVDDIVGGAATDACGPAGHSPDCENSLSFEPGVCPE